MRPGEKLYEELLIGDNPEATEHPRIMKAHEDHLDWAALQVQLSALLAGADANDDVAIRAVLKTCVHGFEPSQWDAL
jgi:FlaA1/EpsC-like NDP-sugar epimerase